MLDMRSPEMLAASAEVNLYVRKAMMQWVVQGMIFLETAARLIALGVDVDDLETKFAMGEAV